MYDKLFKAIKGRRSADSSTQVKHWLHLLEGCGFRLSEPFTHEDILQYFDDPTIPTRLNDVLSTLGYTEEEEPWRPYCMQAYYLDTECIENDHSYENLISRMAAMTKGMLQVSDLVSSVDFDEGRARISFTCNSQQVKLDLEQQDDWCRAEVLGCLTALLNSTGSGLRYFALPVEDQTITIGCAEPGCIKQLKTNGLRLSVWEDKFPIPGVEVTPPSG